MNKKVILSLFLMTAFLLGLTSYASGTASDPLITRSYLEQNYVKQTEEKAAASAASLYSVSVTREAFERASEQAEQRMAEATAELISAQAGERLAARGAAAAFSAAETVTLQRGDRVTGPVGAGVIFTSGTGKIYGAYASQVLDISSGRVSPAGTETSDGTYYMIADGSGGIEVTSASASARLKDGGRVLPAYSAKYTSYADTLKSMGLFLGTGHGYELERTPTRQEALIMLIRLLGEESAALSYEGGTRFTDLTGWADGKKYIAYGESRGYTNGISATAFGQYGDAGAEMYLTFVLRALGYSDSAGDFVWNTTSRTLALEIGLTDTALDTDISENGFRRDHVAMISYNALTVRIKGADITLGERLAQSGAIGGGN